jgi:hypothetical protein
MLAMVLLLAASLAWRTETSRDFGYHVATGRWILEHHAWPRVDSFTYPLAGRPYIDMHGAFQVALALAYGGGMVGVGLMRLAIVIATVVLLWATCRRRAVRSPELLGIGFGLALCAWELRFMARPELASDLCLAAQLLLLRRHHEGGDVRWLYACVPLQLVWVNTHALSLFGIAVLGLNAAASLATGLERRRFERAPWFALAGAIAALFLNPYGARGVVFLWSLRTRIQAGNPFGESITELMSPFSPQAAGVLPLLAFKILLVATALVLLARLRRVTLFDIAVVALFGALAATRVRNVGLCVVAVLPIALDAASGLRRSLPAWTRAWPRGIGAITTAAVVLALAFVAEQTIAGGYYAVNHRPQRFGFAESPAVFPVGTVGFLEHHPLGGPVFNTLDLGGYLILHRPGDKAFIDGRLEVIGEQFYREYSAAIAGDGWEELAARYHPSVALVSNTARALIQRLRGDPAWSAVEVDGSAVLFARDEPDRHAVVSESAERLRRLDAPVPDSAEAILPAPAPAGVAALLGPRRFPFTSWGRGNGLMSLGMLHAARREYRRALLDADRQEPALVKAYVSVVVRLGRMDEARAWCRRLVEIAPHDAQARTLLERLDAVGSRSTTSMPHPVVPAPE